MRKLGNTLYVTTPGAYLGKDGEAVAVRIDEEVKLRIPVHLLDGIVCLGPTGASPYLLGFCGEQGVHVSFLTEQGRFLARVHGPVSGNVLLRRAQYRAADAPERSTAIVRSIVAAKIANTRAVLRRALRDRPDGEGRPPIESAVVRIGALVPSLRGAPSIDVLRGLEGQAARIYFEAFDSLIVQQREAFSFHGRSRRPPLDPTNALLSFLYALLRHDAESALEAVGLDPAVGFLHTDRPGRPGLALDLMEELRAFLCDRLALSLINLRQIRPEGFSTRETGGVEMDDATRKEILVAYQKRKQEELLHPFLREKAPVGLLLHLQAALLARHLRGDLDAYPSFFWKA